MLQRSWYYFTYL